LLLLPFKVVVLKGTPNLNSDDKPVVLKFEIITRRTASEVSEEPTEIYIALESLNPRVVGI
jgi:hypothetical protein